MKERRQIIELWRDETALALITLVRVVGSSYRRLGARLLLSTGGRSAGTISGGCLESEVLRKAGWLVQRGAVTQRYSTAAEDNGDLPYGLGCGGVIDLLMEPTQTPECQALRTALADSLSGREMSVVTWLPRADGELQRVIFAEHGYPTFQSNTLTERDLTLAKQWLQAHSEPPPDDVFVEHLLPPLQLFVLGAGDDVKPLTAIAALLGWRLTVMDGRSQLARAERFPHADSVLVAAADSSELAAIGNRDAVVLMTHSYEQDCAYLAAILPRHPKYLGLLGARHRSSRLIAETADRLGWSVADVCERIHAPVGLNLGGDGPEAVALAVVSQIQALCAGTSVAPRQLSPQEVESYIKTNGSARHEWSHCALDSR